MWKVFNDSGNLYMLSLKQNEIDFVLLLTDLSCLWESRFSTLNLMNSFKESNPLIEANEQQIKDSFLETLEDLHGVNLKVKTEGSDFQLLIEKSADLGGSLNDQKIIYNFTLNKLGQADFHKEITVSAIQTIYFLEKQQTMLLNLIQKKDRELEEYRLEKGDISRGDLKTDKFDATLLSTKNKSLLLNVFTGENSEEFWRIFTEKNGEIESSKLRVELEPWNMQQKKRVIHSGKRVVKKGSGVVFNKE